MATRTRPTKKHIVGSKSSLEAGLEVDDEDGIHQETICEGKASPEAGQEADDKGGTHQEDICDSETPPEGAGGRQQQQNPSDWTAGLKAGNWK